MLANVKKKFEKKFENAVLKAQIRKLGLVQMTFKYG